MALKTFRWDAAEHLETEEDIAMYLDAAFETGDPEDVVHALGVVARARGMTEIARQAGISRGSLYKAIGEDGNPTLTTLMAVMKALGARLAVAPSSNGAM